MKKPTGAGDGRTAARTVEPAYRLAAERYAALGVDTEAALARLDTVPVSIHCWQGDDVTGFEVRGSAVDAGGLLATGAHPGRARNADELRQDLEKAFSLIPGPCRANLHAIYAETGGRTVPRDELGPEHFARWMDWAKRLGIGLDFNPTFFAHPLAAGGTLSSADNAVRAFWIAHGIASRRIAAAMGRATAGPSVNNVWIPDGAKDHPTDRWSPRERLREALDAVFAEEFPRDALRDAVEGKLFGLGSEDYVVGSHEFYLAYCAARRERPSPPLLCMDLGHYHPTESVADKLSAVLAFLDGALLHVSRGVRWDSDHVVIENDDVRALCAELVRGGALGRTFLAFDFFDASINRVAAWVIGARSFRRALLAALLEPTDRLRRLEAEGRGAEKLGLLQELKAMPVGAVWDAHCLRKGVPVGPAWLDEARRYEEDVLAKR